jgi:hypothetical protein
VSETVSEEDAEGETGATKAETKEAFEDESESESEGAEITSGVGMEI